MLQCGFSLPESSTEAYYDILEASLGDASEISPYASVAAKGYFSDPLAITAQIMSSMSEISSRAY